MTKNLKTVSSDLHCESCQAEKVNNLLNKLYILDKNIFKKSE